MLQIAIVLYAALLYGAIIAPNDQPAWVLLFIIGGLLANAIIGPAFFLAGLRGGYKQGQRKAKADMMEAAKFFLENEKRRTDETN